VKTSRGQNAGAEAQDLRMLKTKLVAETDHHPGRRNVKAMLGFVRGPAADDWRTYRSQSRANADIDTFQYHYMAGATFLKWCSADFDNQRLLADLGTEIKQVHAARGACLAAVQDLLRQQLSGRALPSTMEAVLRLMEPATPKAT